MMMISVKVVWYDALETEHNYLASAENHNQLLICLSFGKSQACAHCSSLSTSQLCIMYLEPK